MKFSTNLSISFSDSSSLYTFSICPHLPSVPGADRLILRPMLRHGSFLLLRGGYVVLTYLRIFLYTVWGLYSFGRSINPSAELFTCFCISFYLVPYSFIIIPLVDFVNCFIPLVDFFIDFLFSPCYCIFKGGVSHDSSRTSSHVKKRIITHPIRFRQKSRCR